MEQSLNALDAAGRNVAHYTRFLPRWISAVFIPDRHWGQSANGAETLFQQNELDMLHAVADLLDLSGISVTLDDGTTRTSLEALDEITAALADEHIELSAVERRYIFELINSCRSVFQESATFGQVDLLRRVHELIGVLNMLADTLDSDPATKSVATRIRRAAKKVAPYVSFGAKAVAGSLGAGADLLQITAG
ncbi:hypothetical protein [Microbacterium wangruii]|uniref:hypothetical protein n=1 Tax=Microbacterium wangruii TaxID=3049073 RepID=UPI00256EFECF|nr:hypothetical protein [Microbacterium sp. zg-Y1211]MDL5488166.1 hypothetical protein [Microbacterium sp. zg-Y1211]